MKASLGIFIFVIALIALTITFVPPAEGFLTFCIIGFPLFKLYKYLKKLLIASYLPLLNNYFKDHLFVKKGAGDVDLVRILEFTIHPDIQYINIVCEGYRSGTRLGCAHDSGFLQGDISFNKISLIRLNLSFEGLLSLVVNYLEESAIIRLSEDSLDFKVCKTLFENHDEYEWAISSKIEIGKAIEPLTKAYQASLTNELLSLNKDSLKRAIKILKSELNKLDQYSSQTWNTARKCYEFLSLPANIKLFSEYDAKTLAIDSKSREIRRSFDETMQIKNEYDGLKG